MLVTPFNDHGVATLFDQSVADTASRLADLVGGGDAMRRAQVVAVMDSAAAKAGGPKNDTMQSRRKTRNAKFQVRRWRRAPAAGEGGRCVFSRHARGNDTRRSAPCERWF